MRQHFVVHKQGNLPPTVPTGLVIASLDQGIALLDWNNNPEAGITYRVYHAIDNVNYSLIASPSVSNYTATGLLFTGTHWFKVTAVNTINNESGYSPAQSAQDTVAPAVPTGLARTGYTGTTATIDWNNNVEADFAYYSVYVSTNDVSYSLLASNFTNSVYVAQNLLASTQYFFKVTATDQSGNESARTSSVSTPAVAPSTASAVVPLFNAQGVQSGHGPSDDPFGIFYGRTDLVNGDIFWFHSVPAGLTATPIAGGTYTLSVGSGVTPGFYDLGWTLQIVSTGALFTGTKLLLVL